MPHSHWREGEVIGCVMYCMDMYAYSVHVYTHVRVHACMRTCTRTHMHTPRVRAHTDTHTPRACAHTHTHTHTHTQTHAHTLFIYMYTYIYTVHRRLSLWLCLLHTTQGVGDGESCEIYQSGRRSSWERGHAGGTQEWTGTCMYVCIPIEWDVAGDLL